MSLFESIPSEPRDLGNKDERMWADEAIRAAAHETIDLEERGLLAVRYRSDYGVEFAVFEMFHGPTTDVKTGAIVSGTKWSVIFHGDGTGNKDGTGLRELRHTYWGDEGYIFYPSGKLIADAFAKLKRWFDCD